jgi:hypothetical protein
MTEDVWIDGRVFRVQGEVAAHVKFLSDLNSRFASQLAARAEQVGRMQARLDAHKVTRWTPALKEAVIYRARLGEVERRAVMIAFDLSSEELDAWESALEARGPRGLSTASLTFHRGGRTI